MYFKRSSPKSRGSVGLPAYQMKTKYVVDSLAHVMVCVVFRWLIPVYIWSCVLECVLGGVLCRQ